MNPERAFLQTIIERPDEDLPRLVFADWLEEHGDLPRAEFIRLQCQGAAMPAGAARYEVEERARAIRWEHEQKWLGPLRGRARWWCFHRGFLEECGFNSFHFVRGAASLFDQGPVRRVSLGGMGGRIGRLLELPELVRITHLDLFGDRIGDEGASLLAISSRWRLLSVLHLGFNNITNAGVRALAESSHFPRLTTLDLRNNPVGDDGARALLASSHLPQLKAVCLDGVGLSPEIARRLRERYPAPVDFPRYLPYR
jgi:uncharacterized protein (TIGR02996 family)